METSGRLRPKSRPGDQLWGRSPPKAEAEGPKSSDASVSLLDVLHDYVWLHIHVCMHMYVCIRIALYLHMYTYACVYIESMSRCIHLRMYVHIFMYTYT